MPTEHPAAGRSRLQIEIFEAIAIGQDPPFRRRSIQALLDAKLIEKIGEREISRDRLGSIKVPVYQVPANLHYQWCAWCAEQPDEDGNS